MLRSLFAVFIALTVAACSASRSADPIPLAAEPLSCATTTLNIHQGRNSLLLEGDALSIRAFAPYFTSTTPPVFSFDFKIAGTTNPHPFDLTSDASGKLYVTIFDDLVHGIAMYNHVPSCVNASVSPDAILGGPNTGLDSTYSVAVDKIGRIYVANVLGDGESEIVIFAPGSSGDAAPIATIRGPKTRLGDQTGGSPGFTKSVRVDSQFNIYTSNSIGQIAIFSAGSTGDVAPNRVIAGDKTHLVDPTIALGADDSIYAANFGGQSITVYAPGANGNVAPIRMLSGGITRIELPRAVAVCADGLFYVASLRGVLAFHANSNGTIVPAAVVLGNKSGVFQPIALGF